MNRAHATGPLTSSQVQATAGQTGYPSAALPSKSDSIRENSHDQAEGKTSGTFSSPVRFDEETQNISTRDPSIPLLPPLLSARSERENPGQLTTDMPLSPLSPLSTAPPRKRHGRRKGAVIMIISVVIILAAVLLLPLLWTSPQSSTLTLPVSPGTAPVGQVMFSSSGQLTPNSSQGLNDIVTIALHALKNPAPGHALYAWLLPDQTNDETKPILLGTFTPSHGTIQLTYSDPNHTDLLTNYSAFRITEQATATHPTTPSLNPTQWRYSGSIPATPTPGDENHYSLLSHLRHLLATDPDLHAIGLSGGLDIWLDRNSEKVLEYATAARDDWPNWGSTADLTHRQIVRILQYLDGINYSWQDTPRGTPWLIDHQAGHIGLLDFSPTQEPPGYLSHILLHLNGLIDAPGSTSAQKQIAQQIDVEMQSIVKLYKAVRSDARILVTMSDQQLQQPKALALLDAIAAQANAAYAGQLDPTTGGTQPGISTIHEQLQTLGSFNVTPITT